MGFNACTVVYAGFFDFFRIEFAYLALEKAQF
jgi:hypothetical protein